MKLLDLQSLKTRLLPGTHSLFGTDEDIKALPANHRERLLFLDATSTAKAYQAFDNFDFLAGTDMWGNEPFSKGGWASLQQHLAHDEQALQIWLYGLAVNFATQLLLLPVFGVADSPVILTSWKMFYKYAWPLSHNDNFVAIALDMSWCCYYHHDGQFSFASGPDWARLQKAD